MLKQDASTAQQGLPPDHRTAGTGVIDLTLRVSDCDSLVQGNASVVKPFRWAVVHQPLLRMSKDPDAVDWYVRELIVPDADLAARLAAFGLPARVGVVTLSTAGSTATADVTAQGLHYTATFAAEPGGDVVDQARRDLERGGSADRQFWMQLDEHRSVSVGVDRPAVVTVQGGYLASALPGGSQACTVALSTESVVATFAEIRF